VDEQNGVVLVIDMVRGFHDIGNLKNPRTATIIPNIKELISRKAKDGWLIIFVGDAHKKNDKEFLVFPEHCVEGTEETRIIDELTKFKDKRNNAYCYLPKRRYSAFFETNLEVILSQERPQEVIVMGVCTDICVLYTVADLRMRDYKVFVPKDCVETYSGPSHGAVRVNKWALRHMRDILGAFIVDSQKTL
jgi:nicotinamidase/pyrazinamidase